MPRVPQKAAVARALLGFAEALGLDAQQALAAAELRPEQLTPMEAQIPFEAPIRLWRFMLQRRPGEPLGLMLAEKMRPDAFGLAGHLFRHSENLEQVVARMSQYQSLIDPVLEIEVVTQRERVRVEFHHDPSVLALEHPLEGMVGSGVHTLREWLTAAIDLEVWFAHAPLHEEEVYARYLQVPVHFEQAVNAIVLPVNSLDEPIAEADPSVSTFLERLADERLADEQTAEDQDSHAVQVAQVIESRLDDLLLSQEAVAAELGTSVRTMQRRLQEEESSYTQILEQVRCDVAQRLLRHTEQAVYQVAEQVGYAESANFTRAFRRWTGQSPAEWRVEHDR